MICLNERSAIYGLPSEVISHGPQVRMNSVQYRAVLLSFVLWIADSSMGLHLVQIDFPPQVSPASYHLAIKRQKCGSIDAPSSWAQGKMAEPVTYTSNEQARRTFGGFDQFRRDRTD